MHTIILAGLVWRDFDREFSAKIGDTITIRKPATFTAEHYDQSAGVTYQDATETSVALELDTISNVSFKVTDKVMSLEVTAFDEQFLTPAMEAIAQDLDGSLAEALIDAAEGAGGGGTAVATGSTAENKAFRDARAILGRNNLPLANRYSVLSPEATSEVLGDDLIVSVNRSGATTALREAIVGRLFGFETYETQTLGHGPQTAGQADGVAFHRDAVTLAIRPLDKPKGLPDSQAVVRDFKGLSLRVTYDYDHKYKSDLVSVDVLFGIKATRPEGAVQLNFGLGS